MVLTQQENTTEIYVQESSRYVYKADIKYTSSMWWSRDPSLVVVWVFSAMIPYIPHVT